MKELLIIDPQNDFCDPQGTLFVPGADKDSIRLSNLINRTIDKIDNIHVTMDSHHIVDVAHPIFWENENENHPDPYTIISHSDIVNDIWRPTNFIWKTQMINYTKNLEDNKRYSLCIWPPHCLIGSWGQNIQSDIFNALLKWETERMAVVDYITKGSNIWTEHYSAVQADVPDPFDPSTMLNTKLIESIQNAEIVGITGQALSHCVKTTVEDIMNNFGEENIHKLRLLVDTTSSVPGFENLGENFVKDFASRGGQIVESTEFLK